MKRFFKPVYFSRLLYYIVAGELSFLVAGFFFPFLFDIAQYALLGIITMLCIDVLVLFANPKGIHANRNIGDKLSNGDNNPVDIEVENRFLFSVRLEIIDELPFQFQSRNLAFKITVNPSETKTIQYKLRPTKRGEYEFGALNVYAKSPVGFILRRFNFSQNIIVPVYPSFIQMRKYELLAISNRLTEVGIKKIRKIGHLAQFDTIKEYVSGDDFRTINWKATARKNRFMVNQYQDEKSQQVYSVIDMGRVMRMPFNNLSLLDYAINSSLVISNIALQKQDKAGVISFSHKVHAMLPAERRNLQLQKIIELLYNQKTGYLESDYERLYGNIKTKISQRSLLLLFTNFETLSGMQRQLKYLKRLAKDHLLVVIFFENTELLDFVKTPAKNAEEVCNKIIAEKFIYEKKLIVKELDKSGIQSILTTPENLSVNTINKYLELKARGFI